MRTIQISVETFAAIWKAQKPGEASEEAILRRLLGVTAMTSPAQPDRDLKVVPDGFHDPRYGVKVPSGFEIFRTYRGKRYTAQAIQGFWIFGETGLGYGTLNELSGAIGITNENAWANWFFLDEKGRRKPLTSLRDQSKIVRRNKPPMSRTDKTLDELGL